MDGDTLLTVGGAAIVGFLVVGLVVGALAAATAPQRGADVPDAEWSLDRVNETHVRIVHAGGEAVPASELLVAVESYERQPAWTGSVSEGDATVVQAAADQTVRVYWLRPDSARNVRDQLAQWQA